MSNKRRHHDRKSFRRKKQAQRRLNNRQHHVKVRKQAKAMIEEALSGGLTGLRALAMEEELRIPFLHIYGEPTHIDCERPSPGPAEVSKLSKRIYHRFLLLHQLG